MGNRPGAPPLIRQFRELTKMNTKEITLVDDVVFTGDLLERVAHFLSRIDFKIPLICAGIGIGEGIKRLIKAGYNVRCVRTYEEVIDEICERDFYPGVPLSGRVLINGKNLGVPYLLPFGNPGKWASIPKEQQKPFSKFCIRQTITLFEAVEKHSNKVVCCSDLERKVVSLPRDDTPYVEALRKLL